MADVGRHRRRVDPVPNVNKQILAKACAQGVDTECMQTGDTRCTQGPTNAHMGALISALMLGKVIAGTVMWNSMQDEEDWERKVGNG